jgi:hypothetical protein
MGTAQEQYMEELLDGFQAGYVSQPTAPDDVSHVYVATSENGQTLYHGPDSGAAVGAARTGAFRRREHTKVELRRRSPTGTETTLRTTWRSWSEGGWRADAFDG